MEPCIAILVIVALWWLFKDDEQTMERPRPHWESLEFMRAGQERSRRCDPLSEILAMSPKEFKGAGFAANFPGLLHMLEEAIKDYDITTKARLELSHASQNDWAFIGPPTYPQWMSVISTAALDY